MDARAFWDEEMRSFPHGGRGAAVWVVRRDGGDDAAPVRVIFAWAGGRGAREGLAARPPLGTLLKCLGTGREELAERSGSTALWVEPLGGGGDACGALGIWFDAEDPWREGIFLWGQRFAARLRPLLAQLEPCPAEGDDRQPTLFPVPKAARDGRPAARTLAPAGGERLIPLPRPLVVPGIPGCVGCSAEMLDLGRRIAAVARSGVNVLMHGESGTGKELVARALHLSSDRARGPFVAQNCAALPETLFESELFGHRAGAFTGAAGEKKGLLAAASGGTFFLDEIGDMPAALQVKLLRVMQERRVRRIGELKSVPVDIRFLAATHRDLPEEIAAGGFRLDLYYRLKVVSLRIPPLRQRPEDVAHMLAYFLRREGKDIANMRITESALAALQEWRWPGNVRELENEALRFVALHGGVDVIRREHLSREIREAGADFVDPRDLGVLRDLGRANEMLERYLIRKAIAASSGRKAAAARRLGLSRQGLYKKIARYGMRDLIDGDDAHAG